MLTPFRSKAAILVALLALSAAPLALRAQDASDHEPKVLITRDGEHIELSAPYAERGSRVVFTDRQGRLRSLPREAVDFDAMARPQTPSTTATSAPSGAKAPVLVLTDQDVARYQRPAPQPVAGPEPPVRQQTVSGSSGTEPSSSPPAGGRSDAPAPASVEVIHWDDQGSEEEDEAGTDIWGAIENTGTVPVDAIVIEVRLVSADGTLLANQKVTASENSLLAGAKANFNAAFDRAVLYDDVEFVVSFNELRR